MKQNKLRFIRTTDKETRQKLLDLGYTELPQSSSNVFCFINDGKLVFDDDNKKCVYTNMLCI